MLNQALRRTSGSNVHVTHASSCSAAHARWCSFIARPSAGPPHAGEDAGDVAVQRRLVEVAAEEAERAADDLLADVGGGDVAAGVLDRPQQLDRRRAA